jgi:hypothetical protein
MPRPSNLFLSLLAFVVFGGGVVGLAGPNPPSGAPPTTRPTDGLILEQEITTDIPGAPRASREPQRMVLTIKGARQRMEMGRMVGSITLEDGRSIALSPFDKTYFFTTLSQVKQGMESIENSNGQSDGAGGDPPKLTATGQKKKIGGYASDEYTFQRTVQGRAETVRIWIAPEYPGAKEIRAYQLAHAGVNKQARMIQSGYIGSTIPDPGALPGGMIMRIETELPRGGKSVTTTVSAKFAPVDDVIFEIPKDYKERRLPGMPAGR